MKDTYYDILGIALNATKEEIKQGYRSKIKKYHPDTYLGDKIYAETMTRDLNEAYRILSDEKLKEQYDLTLKYTDDQKNIKDDTQNDETDFVDSAKQSFKKFFSGIKRTFKDGFCTLKQRVYSRREKRLNKKNKQTQRKTEKIKQSNNVQINDKDKKNLTIIITVLTMLLFVLIMIGLII